MFEDKLLIHDFIKTRFICKRDKTINSRLKGILLVLSGAVFWGTTGTSQALISGNPDPLSVGGVRVISAALFLLLFNLIFKIKFVPDVLKNKETYLSAFSLVLYQLFFFTGVKMTGIAVGTVLMLGSSTVFAGILGAVLIGEKPEKRWYLSSMLSVAGCVILLAGVGIELDLKGAFFSVCSGFAYSLFSVFTKKIISKFRPSAYIMTVFIISAVLSVPVIILRQPVWIMSFNGFSVALYLGMFATALAYFLYTGGLRYTKASTAVTLSLAEPATAALLGVFFIGEDFTIFSLTGVLIIFSGLLYLSLPGKGQLWQGKKNLK